ncbi:hypothetical protein NSS94_21515 [Paenibacillus sp. FSL L8-0644]|uniref:hypothetical protein n=1 Tax=Paenibacillus sp. FSL L8-0644 TaxID=2954523 RepID=UPI0030F8BA54
MLDINKEDFIEDISRDNLRLPYQAIEKLTSLMKLVFDNYPKESIDNAADISRLHLLSRLYNDLKSIYLLSLKGYSVQAATIACAFYEAALTVICIDNEEEKGRKWLKHKDTVHGYSKTSVLNREVVKKLNWSSDTWDNLKKVYTYLSMAKHSNPLILTVHSFVEVNDDKGSYKDFNYGPEVSEASFRLSWYSILMSMQLGNAALGTYVNNLAELIDDHLFIEMQELHSEFLDLLDENIRVSAKKYG